MTTQPLSSLKFSKEEKEANIKALVSVDVSPSETEVLKRQVSDLLETLQLVVDLASTEWQNSTGKRCYTVDNQGRRLHFISEDVIQAVRDELEAHKIHKVITLSDALAMGRRDLACAECPESCEYCSDQGKCIFPVMG